MCLFTRLKINQFNKSVSYQLPLSMKVLSLSKARWTEIMIDLCVKSSINPNSGSMTHHHNFTLIQSTFRLMVWALVCQSRGPKFIALLEQETIPSINPDDLWEPASNSSWGCNLQDLTKTYQFFYTVVWEIFNSNNISWVQLPTKYSYIKIYYHNQ